MFKNVSKALLLFSVSAFFIVNKSPTDPICAQEPNHYAENVGLKKEKKTLRKEIVRFADSHKGKRYRSGGRGPKTFDCSGFTWYVMDHFNISIPKNSWSQAGKGIPVKLEDARTGDLIFFGNKKGVNHVGLILYHKDGKMKVIHSTTSRGVIIEDVLSSRYWKPKILYVRDLIPKKGA